MSDKPEVTGPLSFLDAAWGQFVHTVEYAITLQTAHGMLAFVSAIVGGVVAHAIPRALKRGVDSESVVESETYYQPSGKINPATGREFVDQVIHTQSTYNLSHVFAEATLNRHMLTKIVKKAAKRCTDNNPVVWAHLHEAMDKKSGIYSLLPGWLGEKFGHFSEDRRKVIINEMARCVRNFRSEQLTSADTRLRHIDPAKREKIVWKRDMSVLIFQEGAGADVFTSIRLPEELLTYQLPLKEDTRFLYDDPDNAVIDEDSHLYERVNAMKSIQRVVTEDLASDNPVVAKFFVRYPSPEVAVVPAAAPA